MNPARRMTATALVLATAGGVLHAAVPASAAVSCASPVFKRQFFANTTFSGTPKKTDCDSAINQNWGTGAPAPGMPSNHFGVRWTVTRDFGSGGPFTFTASAQDGMRVYLDGVRKINAWKNVSATVKKTVHVTIPKGTHTIRFDFVNWTGSAKAGFAYTPRTSAAHDKVRPLTPTGAAVSYNSTTGAAKLTWTGNREMDLAGYRVYRRLKGTPYGSKPLATTTATSYTDSALPRTGAAYSYEVRAVDRAGHASGGSTDVSVTTVDRTPPAAPFVEWDACPAGRPYAAPELVTTAQNAADIVRYEMQRLDAATKRWSTVYSGAEGAICDTGYRADGSKVTYRGRARDAAGNWSAYSAATTFTTPDLTPPAPVTGLRAEYRSGVPHLLWSPVPGAASYQVLQYDPATGGYTDARPAGSPGDRTDVVPLQTAAVADGYRYAVRSLDAGGNAAAPVEITLEMADRPEAIPAFKTTAKRFDEGVMVAWSSVDPWTLDERRLPTYKILRTDTATGETAVVDKCKPFTSVDQPLADPDTYWTWADDDAPLSARKQVNGGCWDVQGESETTYEYRVVTTDRYGRVSQAGPPATETTPDTRRPAPVQDLTAERVPLGVRLTWTPPADADVRGYHVWQGVTDPDSGETVWKEDCWTGSSLTATEILCPTVADGAVHVYKVAATDDRLLHDDDPLDVLHPAEVSVTLPDTRPPGWTGTDVRQGQYPQLYVGCSESSGLGDCSRLARYRVERWDAVTAAYVTLTEGATGDATSFLDTTVHEDRLGLYYYRVVRLDASGAEAVTRSTAYGIWDTWL
ncbi:PA14 domain-containing protein [Streptomyces sp. NBC_01178]|uniref:PA14 domain-containing protein n=1 Tax=Streptomyces sp. NBC_01178 TaxID=2903762 RepID=UPI003867541B|nr:PA14 domain-containing protein [Streptomyces sp. NBC_01178]